MLIRRDSLAAKREAMQWETIQSQTAELVNEGMGTSGTIDEWTAKAWLQLQYLTTTPQDTADALRDTLCEEPARVLGSNETLRTRAE